MAPSQTAVCLVPLFLTTLTFLSGPVPAQPARDERDPGGSGAMSLEELRREPIAFELDVPYAGSRARRHRLDIYLPKPAGKPRLPVIVFFHGGGWMQGDKADGAARLIPFVRTGEYAGISAGYRLSGEATWPAQIHDGKAVIRWIRANAEKYGLDVDRIGVWGRDAGGHLVLMLGVSNDVAPLEGDVGPYRGTSSRVSAVANFFGVSELLAIIGQTTDIDRTQERAPEAMLIGGALPANPDIARSASPITYVTANDAPVLTVHGTEDRTVPYDQAVRFDAALRKLGVPSHFVTIRGAGHGDFGAVADDRLKSFFDRYLRGENVEISTAPIEISKQ